MRIDYEARVATRCAAVTDTFEDLRDTAIIRLLLDTGLQRTELAILQLDDIDLDLSTAYERLARTAH